MALEIWWREIQENSVLVFHIYDSRTEEKVGRFKVTEKQVEWFNLNAKIASGEKNLEDIREFLTS